MEEGGQPLGILMSTSHPPLEFWYTAGLSTLWRSDIKFCNKGIHTIGNGIITVNNTTVWDSDSNWPASESLGFAHPTLVVSHWNVALCV